MRERGGGGAGRDVGLEEGDSSTEGRACGSEGPGRVRWGGEDGEGKMGRGRWGGEDGERRRKKKWKGKNAKRVADGGSGGC